MPNPNTGNVVRMQLPTDEATLSAAVEGKPKNIRVNAVLPGAIDTPMLWDSPNVKAGLEKLK